MLGKLGMTVADCIYAYYDLSKMIFGKKNLLGRLTLGLSSSRFSELHLRTCIDDLVARKRDDKNLPMASDGPCDRIACAVVCREHEDASQYSRLKDQAVCLCSSKPCPELLECSVSEAARATTAAPTFFPAQLIHNRLFIDGGVGFNNPSEIILHHYSKLNCGEGSAHQNLDLSRVRVVNLGTGTEPAGAQPKQKRLLHKLQPTFFRKIHSLTDILKGFATSPKDVANRMVRQAGQSSNGDFKYARFSADNGVHNVEMHKFRHIVRVRALTRQYLRGPLIQERLNSLAEEIVDDYIMNEERPEGVTEEIADDHIMNEESLGRFTTVTARDIPNSRASLSARIKSQTWSGHLSQSL